MRAHKCITELKEEFHYDLSNISNEQIEYITNSILQGLKINRVRTPIIDVANKLGFTVYNIPFEKEECSELIHGFLGIGIEFSMNENSSFCFVEKNMSDEDKRFFVAYLLAHYLLHVDERSTDYFKHICNKGDIKNTPELRLFAHARRSL